uniref:Uncharacterized protein n=1 Tax=Arundo donax TaxID=35708 RepID=A0A0A9CLZ6_ARUDO
MAVAFITSCLWTVPKLQPMTGTSMEGLFKCSTIASRVPTLDACTQTPSLQVLILLISCIAVPSSFSPLPFSLSGLKALLISCIAAASYCSRSSSGFTTITEVPAIACCNPRATIFTPCAALSSS